MDELFALALEIQSQGLADAKKHLAEIDSAGKGIAGRFNNLLKPINLVKGALAGIGLAITAKTVTEFFGKAISEAGNAQQALERYKQSLQNAGTSFDAFGKDAQEAAERLQEFTRFGDDEAIAALAEMTTISKDAAGSIKNLGLAADIAAAKQIDLQSAATLVGRVMAGNTSMLARYGIVVKEGTDAMEALRATFGGFAERDGATFQGRLEQLRGAVGNLFESIGNLIIGGDELSGGFVKLREKIVQLSTYIDNNAERWRAWAKDVIDGAGVAVKQIRVWLLTLAMPLNTIANLASAAGFAIRTIFAPQQWRRNFEELNAALARIASDYKQLQGAEKDLFASQDDLARKRASNSARARDDAGKERQEIEALRAAESRRQNAPRGGGGSGGGGVIGSIKPRGQMPGIGMAGVSASGGFGGPLKGPTKVAELPEMQETAKILIAETEEFTQNLAGTIRGSIASTLGSALRDGFATAFETGSILQGLAAFGKAILAGFGGLLTQLGQTWLEYGILMTSLGTALFNPITSGPAAIAIGAAMVALGAALGAVGRGGGRSGHSASMRDPRYGAGTQEATTLKFVNRPDANTRGLTRQQPLHVTIIGENDPKAQRMLQNMLEKGKRRVA